MHFLTSRKLSLPTFAGVCLLGLGSVGGGGATGTHVSYQPERYNNAKHEHQPNLQDHSNSIQYDSIKRNRIPGKYRKNKFRNEIER